MIRSIWTTLLAVASASSLSAGERSVWVNVMDFGATGSKFETTAVAAAGSKQVTVAKVGDFQVGQGVMVSRCNVRYTHGSLWGPKKDYARSEPLKDAVQMRGYDGTAGSWVVYVLDVGPGKRAFRWTDDLGRTWHPDTSITGQWQTLGGNTEVRFGQRDWESGYVVVISARDQLMTTIEKIEGNVLTLKDAANRSVKDAVVRHCDDAAIQAAVDRAVKEKRNVYFPIGHYRLAHGIAVQDAAAVTLEGQSAVDTLLDISDGEGSCFALRGGDEVTLRNFRLVGHMGFDRRDQAGAMSTRGAGGVWGFYFKLCNALNVSGTERVLVENCHASRMSCECFYSAGPGRWKGSEPKKYTKALTFLRCSVTDAARNAFNNNDFAENTSVLYCRIVDVGGCSWEGASRFVRFIGNYVRNGGTVAMGNIGSREASLEELGSGQHIIADNVFESCVPYGGCAVRAAVGATQVIIRNNLFVNFASSAVEVLGTADERHLPAGISTITGNIFDMTNVGGKQVHPRAAVKVSATATIVADNQIYVRGGPDPLVRGIVVGEPAVNVNVHDNLIRHCGAGLLTERVGAVVGEVIDGVTFRCRPGGTLMERRQSHRYRGWNLAWLTGTHPKSLSVIEGFDPETFRFTLHKAHDMKPGDRFEVFPPAANWNIHDNTIAGCLRPVVLDSYGSETSLFHGNLIVRGEATGVKTAVEVRGRFNLTDNHFSGFDEKGCPALTHYADPYGRVSKNVYRDNDFDRCTEPISAGQAER